MKLQANHLKVIVRLLDHTKKENKVCVIAPRVYAGAIILLQDTRLCHT